jgi:hypothetical protein
MRRKDEVRQPPTPLPTAATSGKKIRAFRLALPGPPIALVATFGCMKNSKQFVILTEKSSRTKTNHAFMSWTPLDGWESRLAR